jgi:hypothetical protein
MNFKICRKKKIEKHAENSKMLWIKNVKIW